MDCYEIYQLYTDTVDVVVSCYVTPLWYYASYYFVKDEPDLNEQSDLIINYVPVNGDSFDIETEESQSLLFPNQRSQKINTN